MEQLTPRQIVEALNTYIVGQKEAKKMVAIALRNRWRAKQLPESMREEYVPKNLLLIGPTGVGKTEIARRLAKLVKAPFVKVEATKFTEVGYVGRDVDSMIRDLVENAVHMFKAEALEAEKIRAEELANERILEILWPKKKSDKKTRNPMELLFANLEEEKKEEESVPVEESSEKRKLFFEQIKAGLMDSREIEIEVEEAPKLPFGNDEGGPNEGVGVILGMMPKSKKKRRVTVKHARKILIDEEGQKLLDMDAIQEKAVEAAEQEGIIFIDEIDKVASTRQGGGPDVSREGVQRDILPIVEGATVKTKYGPVKTDHILFIGAGAFHVAKPSDLIPELQGRFPIRVELQSLSVDDFKAILTEPKQALLKQYTMLLEADGVTVKFGEDAIQRIAELAYQVNNEQEDIGARRLHTMLEKLLQDVSYNAPAESNVSVDVTAEMVNERLGHIVADVDMSKYIL